MKKIKLNIIDILVITILAILFVTVYVSSVYKKPVEGKQTKVTVRVINVAGVTYPDKSSEYGTIFLNSVNRPIDFVSSVQKKEGSNVTWTDITLKGKGNIEDDRIIFEGARILIGQKAEIHSNYFAQGIITEIKYADE